jgi:membrane protein DedA with SNARE-associated domain
LPRRGVGQGVPVTSAELLSQYGYLALAIGCFLEGETLLLLAGVAAHGGFLSLPLVVLVAFVSGTLGDQFYFFVGRRWGDKVLGRWPRFEAPAARVERLIERHAEWLIVGVRFMYGLRLIGPVVIGMSKVSPLRFIVFNMIGAAIWAIVVAGAGYFFGHAIQWLLADLELFEKLALVCVVVVVIALLARRWHRNRSP